MTKRQIMIYKTLQRKLKRWQKPSTQKTEMNSGTPEAYVVFPPLMQPVVLLLLKIGGNL